MTEWRDAAAFFLTSVPEDDERWLRSLSRTIGLRSDGLRFDDNSRVLPCEWAGLESRAQLLGGSRGSILVVSYFSREFRDLARQPDRWRGFCRLFGRACLALSPTVAVALGTISDDIPSDIRAIEAPVAEQDGAWLRSRPYALSYLCPELDRAALEESPASSFPSVVLADGGRVTWDWEYDDFPE
ncbi:hypothetical protein ACGF5C_26130 [Micromonospora sp. NPDC047620]|uniref:hypothetical protein n=1 Tax=Micromonospora sp. NPDC047620 TaxID=3364251 RepID=UPI00371A70F7